MFIYKTAVTARNVRLRQCMSGTSSEYIAGHVQELYACQPYLHLTN